MIDNAPNYEETLLNSLPKNVYLVSRRYSESSIHPFAKQLEPSFIDEYKQCVLSELSEDMLPHTIYIQWRGGDSRGAEKLVEMGLIAPSDIGFWGEVTPGNYCYVVL